MKNTLKTTMLLATMGALIMFISSFWGSGGLTIGLFLALAMVGGSYWMSDKLAIRSARAIEVEKSEEPIQRAWSSVNRRRARRPSTDPASEAARLVPNVSKRCASHPRIRRSSNYDVVT